MYVSEPANLHIFYVHICRCVPFGVPNPNTIATVMVEGGAYVPSVFAVGGPRAVLRWGFVCNNADARGRNGSGVVIAGSIDLGPRGKLGVDA